MNVKEFWRISDMLDWNAQGDDEKVLKPAADYLARLSDEEIFEFEDIMSKLLYDLDSEKIAHELYGGDNFSGDLFLYQRCVALINGEGYYAAVLSGITKLDTDGEFESLLYLPCRAWAKKHKADPRDYPHIPEISYETGSNKELW